MSSADSRFEHVVAVASADEHVVGLVLAGSRGKEGSYVTPLSDYDLYVIVADDDAQDAWHERFPSRHGDPIEILVMTIDAYRSHALPGSSTEWNAYTFAHVTPLLDRLGGEVEQITAEKGKRDPDASAPTLLDGYINAYYRSKKNARDGLALESRLDAAESVPLFLDFLFAAFGRVRPYNKWLLWELRAHPLPPPWTGSRVLAAITAILESADHQAQAALFRDVETLARTQGWANIVDGWEPDVGWLRCG